MHVRISLIRYYAALYRRERLEHKHEAALIEVDYWKEGYKEDQGG